MASGETHFFCELVQQRVCPACYSGASESLGGKSFGETLRVVSPFGPTAKNTGT